MGVQPQGGRELRRRLVEMTEQKEDHPSVQWLGSSLGASSTDFRAFASAASGSYSGKSGCISNRARNQSGPANSGSSWRTLSARLPGTVERRDPILRPAPIRLIKIREGQALPRRHVIRVEIDRPLCELLRLAHVGGVEAKVGLGCFYEVLPASRLRVP